MTRILGKKTTLTNAELSLIKRDVDLSSAQKSGCYLTEKTLRLHYKIQQFFGKLIVVYLNSHRKHITLE